MKIRRDVGGEIDFVRRNGGLGVEESLSLLSRRACIGWTEGLVFLECVRWEVGFLHVVAFRRRWGAEWLRACVLVCEF